MPIAGVQISENGLRPMDQNIDSVCVISDCCTDAERASQLLKRSGYSGKWVSDVESLSNNLTEKSGFSEHSVATILCHRKFKDYPSTPLNQLLPGQRIIVLSDCESEQTVVSLLNSGAHYFFNLRETESLLQARLEAALRFNDVSTNNSFTVGDIYFDAIKRVVVRRGKLIDLSPKEYELAFYLFSNRERIVCNSELMTSIWSLPASNDTRRIDTAACRLRKKLLLNTENGWQLKRLRSIGYRLIPVPEDIVDEQVLCEPRVSAQG